MISGTFHPISQEWRYFSREKALIHTLHLAQLPASRVGETVEIASTAPTSNPKPPGIPPLALPSGPEFFTNAQFVTNSSMKITCYGSVGCDGSILAQSSMGITIGTLGGTLSQIRMTPEESGIFVVAAECYTDLQSFSYEGVANDGRALLEILNGGAIAAKAEGKIKMEGTQWSTDSDIYRRIRLHTSCLAVGGDFLAQATNLGNVSDCCLSMWAMKVADLNA